MNGIRDLGGRHGMGPMDRNPHHSIFRADWERRMFPGYFRAFGRGGRFNIDQFRAAIEEMKPAEFSKSDYSSIGSIPSKSGARQTGRLLKKKLKTKDHNLCKGRCLMPQCLPQLTSMNCLKPEIGAVLTPT